MSAWQLVQRLRLNSPGLVTHARQVSSQVLFLPLPFHHSASGPCATVERPRCLHCLHPCQKTIQEISTLRILKNHLLASRSISGADCAYSNHFKVGPIGIKSGEAIQLWRLRPDSCRRQKSGVCHQGPSFCSRLQKEKHTVWVGCKQGHQLCCVVHAGQNGSHALHVHAFLLHFTARPPSACPLAFLPRHPCSKLLWPTQIDYTPAVSATHLSLLYPGLRCPGAGCTCLPEQTTASTSTLPPRPTSLSLSLFLLPQSSFPPATSGCLLRPAIP